MSRRVLVTRPEPGASTTARALVAAGFEPVVVPLIDIRAIDTSAQRFTGRFDAVAVTSPNALRHAPAELLAHLLALPAFAVGETSAAAARAAGFGDVTAGPGEGVGMAAMMAAALPAGSRVAYPCGRVRRPELERLLGEAGIAVEAVETYDAVPVELARVPPLVGPFHAALAHSPESARALAALERRADARAALAGVRHVAISQRAAAALPGVPTRIAAAPTDAAMIAALRAWQ